MVGVFKIELSSDGTLQFPNACHLEFHNDFLDLNHALTQGGSPSLLTENIVFYSFNLLK